MVVFIVTGRLEGGRGEVIKNYLSFSQARFTIVSVRSSFSKAFNYIH